MTRTFMWVTGAALLTTGAFFTARHLAPARDDAALRDQVQALSADLERLRADLASRDRAAGQQAGRLVNAPQFSVSAPAKETIEEEEARVEREAKTQAVKEAEYYARLDRELRLSPPALEPRSQLQKNLEALAAAKLEPAPLAIEKYECAEGLCRLEVRRLGMPAPNALASALRHLTRGMAETSMRPFDRDRSVIYAAPKSHKLPAMDL